MPEFKELEDKINYTFIDKNILRNALTHSSFLNEHGKDKNATKENITHNERLEFLGDAVLEIIISDELFRRYPNEREGLLTHSRSSLVNENTLAQLAKTLGLDEYVLLGKGEENQGGRQRPSILSDTLEALFAAVFMDAKKNPKYDDPLVPARNLINSLYENLWQQSLKPKASKDYKTLLQELTQSLFKDAPKYALVGSEGPEHLKVFTVELSLPNDIKIRKSGTNKKKAEQEAAQEAYEMLKNQQK